MDEIKYKIGRIGYYYEGTKMDEDDCEELCQKIEEIMNDSYAKGFNDGASKMSQNFKL